ncbi:ABC transporter substrate-binding protein [Cupriavidus sp. NPDC089707]|uniref:ABC transporter substrate-binding protein n=1 Tax=Cupriavidus sp. NPDC089707 TaxID=3363963 RepID=UPI003821937E
MRKITAVAMAALTLSLTATSAFADQLADIKQRGSLVCGVLGTVEPFSFSNPQTREVQGYDVDFCTAIAKSLGVKVELKQIAVSARIPELQQGRVDILAAALGWTPERAQQIAYSDQYYVSLTKVAVKRSEGFKSVADLAGKRVSANKGSTSETAVKKAVPTASTVTFQDAPTAFLALQQGRVEGLALGEMMLVKFRMQADPSTPIEILEPPVMHEQWGLGMRKGESAFITHVNGVLQSMETSGEASKIFDKWLGSSTAYKLRRDFKVEQIKG